jgi:hypothetical protein
MTKQHTDADVARLVDAATAALQMQPDFCAGFDPRWSNLRETLLPFLPDPEDALIEEMAMAISGSGDWYSLTPEYHTRRRNEARAALAVVKREGWGPK